MFGGSFNEFMQLFYFQSFYESFGGSVLQEQVTGGEFGSKKLWQGVWTSKYEYQNINWMVKLEIKRIILMKPLVSWMFNDTHRGREPEAILIKKRVADWQSWLIWLPPSSSISFSSFLSPFSKPSFSFFSSFISLFCLFLKHKHPMFSSRRELQTGKVG